MRNFILLTFLVPILVSCSSPVVTKSEFERIKPGMSYNELEIIIGAPGVEVSRSEVPGKPKTVTYNWKNSDNSNMTATFIDGKLTNKVESGLK